MRSEKYAISAEAEREFEWQKWAKQIPFIKFPVDWEVQIIPPMTAAIVRFRVNTPTRKNISIYLDCYEQLGFFGGPHWEVYPDKDDNNSRFKIDDVKGLLACIAGEDI